MKLYSGLCAALLFTSALGLSSCSTWNKLDRTERGAVIGGSAGAVLGGSTGSATGAVLGGAAGALAGGVIGHETDEDRDRRARHRDW